MNRILKSGALACALILAASSAHAQDVHYRAADGLNSTPVSRAAALPVTESIQGEVATTAGGTAIAVTRALKVNCTVAGNVAVTYADGSTGVWIVAVGTTVIPASITNVNTSGTTATATYAGLY